MTRPALDPDVLASLRELTPSGAPDVLVEVLTIFRDEVPRRLERVRAAIQARDAADLHRVAHSLKGSAGNIGAVDLLELCREIDERARVGDVSGAALLLEDVEQEIARVEAAIAAVID